MIKNLYLTRNYDDKKYYCDLNRLILIDNEDRFFVAVISESLKTAYLIREEKQIELANIPYKYIHKSLNNDLIGKKVFGENFDKIKKASLGYPSLLDGFFFNDRKNHDIRRLNIKISEQEFVNSFEENVIKSFESVYKLNNNLDNSQFLNK